MRRNLFFMLSTLLLLSGCGQTSMATEPRTEYTIGLGHGIVEAGPPRFEVVHTDTMDVLLVNGKRFWSISRNFGSAKQALDGNAVYDAAQASSKEEWISLYSLSVKAAGSMVEVTNSCLWVTDVTGLCREVTFPQGYPVEVQVFDPNPPQYNFEAEISMINDMLYTDGGPTGAWWVWGDYLYKLVDAPQVPRLQAALAKVYSGTYNQEDLEGTALAFPGVLEDVLEAQGGTR